MKDRSIFLFTSPTCGPCRVMKPVLLKLQEQFKFKVKTFELSAENRDMFAQYGVRQVPFVLCLEDRDGAEHVAGNFFGGKTEEQLRATLKSWGLIPQ